MLGSGRLSTAAMLETSCMILLRLLQSSRSIELREQCSTRTASWCRPSVQDGTADCSSDNTCGAEQGEAGVAWRY